MTHKAPAIQKLDQSVVNRIAAGEVINSPSNVVKELMENCIDAGATRITINLERGGYKMLRIIDDGCGIRASDLPIVAKRHTTSKIKTYSDLTNVSTFGFRGEAIFSVSCVSHLRITTKTSTDNLGSQACYLDGELDGSITPCSNTVGTTIEVMDLFYNYPLRLKTIKPTVEANSIIDIVRKYSVVNSGIAFLVTSEGREALRTYGNTTYDSVLRLLYQIEESDAFFRYDFQLAPQIFSISFVNSPFFIMKKKNASALFINNRLVSNDRLQKGIEQVYSEVSEMASTPFYFILLSMPQQNIDVNIHPSKKIVKFLDEALLIETLCTKLKESLEEKAKSRPILNLPQKSKKKKPIPGKNQSILTAFSNSQKSNDSIEESQSVKSPVSSQVPNQESAIIDDQTKIVQNNTNIPEEELIKILANVNAVASEILIRSNNNANDNSTILPDVEEETYDFPLPISNDEPVSQPKAKNESPIISKKLSTHHSDVSVPVTYKKNEEPKENKISKEEINSNIPLSMRYKVSETIPPKPVFKSAARLWEEDNQADVGRMNESIYESTPSKASPMPEFDFRSPAFIQNITHRVEALQPIAQAVPETKPVEIENSFYEEQIIEDIKQSSIITQKEIKKAKEKVIKPKRSNIFNELKYEPNKSKKSVPIPPPSMTIERLLAPSGNSEKRFRIIEIPSIVQLREQVIENENKELKDFFVSHKMSGLIQDRYIILSNNVSLKIFNLFGLVKDYNYQKFLAYFANFDPIKVKINIEECLEFEIDDSDVRKRISNEIASHSSLLQDYFSMEIDNGVITAMPKLFTGYKPTFSGMPLFLTHLSETVNWNDELDCFDQLLLEFASLYSIIPGEDENDFQSLFNHVTQTFLPDMKTDNYHPSNSLYYEDIPSL